GGEPQTRGGGGPGGDQDADTGSEDISLHCEVSTDDVEDALPLLAEQCSRSPVPADRFAKEQRVVIDEIRGRQEDPANYVHERAWARFFGGSLAHPVCGTIASVRRMSTGALRRFIAPHFLPSNVVLAVVGDLSRQPLRRAIER